MRIVVALAVAATLGAPAAAPAQVGDPVEGAFRAHGLALHGVDRFALLVTRKDHTVVVSFNVFGSNPQPRFLAPKREMHDFEVVVFRTRGAAARAAPLYAHNPLAAALRQGPVMVVYDRGIAPATLARVRAAVRDLPK